MLAFPDEESARNAYLNSYERGWTGLHSLVPVTIDQLKWWLKHGDMRQPLKPEHLPHAGTSTMKKIWWNANAAPEGITLDQLLYDVRRAEDGTLLLDAVTVTDILEDSEGVLTFDALVTPYVKLQRRMEILQGIMDRTGGGIKVTAL